MTFIPIELVREIILCILDVPSRSDISDEIGSNTKPDWALIQSFTLASKTYRTLALEAWFRTLCIKSPSDILHIQVLFPDICIAWTRELHCVEYAYDALEWDLSVFKRLTKIRFDMVSYYSVVEKLSFNLEQLPFPTGNCPSTLYDLDVRGLVWPSPSVLLHIANTCPELRVLRMHQPRIWCTLCHTCERVRFQEPGPEKIVYEGGLGLPQHYARALSSLAHLHTVILTIADFGSGKTTLADDDDHNQNMWAGECDRCMEVMYEDDTFRERWVAKKKGIVEDWKGNDVAYQRHRRPPALKRVEWRFWTAVGGRDYELGSEDDPDDESE